MTPSTDDDDDERRRRMLAGNGDDISSYTAQALAPDDDDDADAGSVKPDNAVIGPAQQKYVDLLGKQPKQSDYQPSKWRRVGAAIAGGLSGLRDPRLGVQVAQNIVGAPYQQAQSQWQNAMGGAQAAMGLEQQNQKATSANAIAQQRATAYTQSAQARTKIADATQVYRNFQQSQEQDKWAHQQQQDAIHNKLLQDEFDLKAKTPPKPVAWQPTTQDQYVAVHPHTDPLAVESQRHQNRLGEQTNAASLRAHAVAKADKVPKMDEQAKAEQMGIQDLMRTNPEYAQFVGQDPKTGAHFVKGLDEVTRGVKWYDVVGAAKQLASGGPPDPTVTRLKYQQFLTDLHKKKQENLGSQSGGVWKIEPQEDEEEDQ
jgi:hypothetical protein